MQATEYPPGDVRVPAPVIEPGHSYRSVTEKLSAIVLTKNTPLAWFITTAIGFMLVMALMVALTYLFLKGIGIWGNSKYTAATARNTSGEAIEVRRSPNGRLPI